MTRTSRSRSSDASVLSSLLSASVCVCTVDAVSFTGGSVAARHSSAATRAISPFERGRRVVACAARAAPLSASSTRPLEAATHATSATTRMPMPSASWGPAEAAVVLLELPSLPLPPVALSAASAPALSTSRQMALSSASAAALSTAEPFERTACRRAMACCSLDPSAAALAGFRCALSALAASSAPPSVPPPSSPSCCSGAAAALAASSTASDACFAASSAFAPPESAMQRESSVRYLARHASNPGTSAAIPASALTSGSSVGSRSGRTPSRCSSRDTRQ